MFSWSLNLNANLKGLRDVSEQQQQQQPLLPNPQNQNLNYLITSTATPTPKLQHDVAIFSTDEFRMYYYKIKQCPQPRSHDWKECPFAHRGEKAKRRDPRKVPYWAISCPAHKIGKCQKGDSCEFAHGLFEYWLHPARYRTRPCNLGRFCYRQVCFFAHTQEELRSDMVPACNKPKMESWILRPDENVGSTSSTCLVYGEKYISMGSHQNSLGS